MPPHGSSAGTASSSDADRFRRTGLYLDEMASRWLGSTKRLPRPAGAAASTLSSGWLLHSAACSSSALVRFTAGLASLAAAAPAGRSGLWTTLGPPAATAEEEEVEATAVALGVEDEEEEAALGVAEKEDEEEAAALGVEDDEEEAAALGVEDNEEAAALGVEDNEEAAALGVEEEEEAPALGVEEEKEAAALGVPSGEPTLSAATRAIRGLRRTSSSAAAFVVCTAAGTAAVGALLWACGAPRAAK